MSEWLYNRYRANYIAVVMLMTRLIGSIGGALAIYYVLLTTRVEAAFVPEFIVGCLIAVTLGVSGTMPLAFWNTRTLRRVLERLHRGLPVDRDDARSAAREAVCFPSRQNTGEAVLVPLLSILPMCAYLWWRFDPRPVLYLQLTIAGGLAVAAVLLITFIASERWMQVVVLDLIRRGVQVDFDSLPQSRLRRRMVVCFGLISMITSIMIGALANQRARDIIDLAGVEQNAAVENLRWHTLYITLVSLVVGFVYSRLLADSVASRANRLVKIMQRVQAGDLAQRARPTGTDEIDALARQFNCMVETLEQHDRTVRDLNVNLERKVQSRTEELAQSKRSLQSSLERLRESDRHKTEFFSNVSHELRTPLMMILSPLEQIAEREESELSPRSRSLVDVASVNAHRLLKLINQLLDFAKFEAGHAELNLSSVDVDSLISTLVAAAEPLAEQRGLTLTADLDPGLPAVAGDSEKLDAVITNLLSNALKFTPRGGSVRVVARRSHGGINDAEEQLRIAVEDTGIGIAPENFSRLFQRFSQIDGSTSRQFAGTGIGLALVKEIVELHGGDIHVESRPGQGSCFWFTLPVRQPNTVAASESAPSVPMVRAERFADLLSCTTAPEDAETRRTPADAPTVLVVDDTPEVRQLVGEILEGHYHVRYAEDGESGWDSIQAIKPDLIISDVMMPRVDGYELCRRVKSNAATEAIPFVLLTARAQTSLKIEGLNRGADDYLVKPFNSEELLARVRALLRLHELHSDLEEKNSRLETTLSELQETQSQLVQSEKMNALGQLVAGVAHEINNAINAVCNGIPAINERLDRLQHITARLLEQPADDPATARQELEQAFRMLRQLAGVVEEGAGRTARIVGDMKSFSHPGSETFEPFDLNASLDLCVGLLDKQYRERVRISRDYQAEGWVRGPYGRLNQVFINLLTNAAQAMPDGGDIDISTRTEGAFAVVAIRDTGTGIPEAVRSRIFDPFFTTKGPGKGTGLGLSTSYGIVTRLGGRIECHSLEGIGTEFIVFIPLNPEGTPVAGHSTPPEEPELVASAH